MNFAKGFITVLVVALFLVIACNPKPAPAPVPTGPVSTAPAGGVTLTGWEADWAKTLTEAKKEGKVSVYASLLGPPIRGAATIFKDKYGIELEITTGRGSDVARKLIAESKAGINLADVAISGLNTFFGDLKPAGASKPMESELIFPDVRDPRNYYTGDRLPWADEAKHVFSFFGYPNTDIHINADFVSSDEAKSWKDLLNPKYKGKIMWSDPSVAGSGLNGFSTLIYHKVLTPDYYRELVAKQDIQVTRDLRFQVDSLARGKAWFAISAEGTPVQEFIKAGANLAGVLAVEGTYLSVDAGNMSIVAKPAHPYAARVFVNWLLSKEGQVFLQQAVGYQSSRTDVGVEGVNKENTRQPGAKYYIGANNIEKWVLEEQESYIKMARDIFGPAIR